MKLLPFHGKKKERSWLEKSPIDVNAYFGRPVTYFSSGKAAIHYLMKHFRLQREDEVYISTTSNSSFVSSCVTSTIFNYCKVSRVLTDKTKMIFVIHEFGYPNLEIKGLVEDACRLGVPLVEDVAHALNSKLEGTMLGGYGDFSIHSLPKSFPVETGGILVGEGIESSARGDSLARATLNEWLPYMDSLKKRKKTIIDEYRMRLNSPTEIFGYDEDINPFVYGFFTEKYREIDGVLEENDCEVARTYVPDRVLLPVNPFSTEAECTKALELIKAIMDMNE